jgi:hypothetical protein
MAPARCKLCATNAGQRNGTNTGDALCFRRGSREVPLPVRLPLWRLRRPFPVLSVLSERPRAWAGGDRFRACGWHCNPSRGGASSWTNRGPARGQPHRPRPEHLGGGPCRPWLSDRLGLLAAPADGPRLRGRAGSTRALGRCAGARGGETARCDRVPRVRLWVGPRRRLGSVHRRLGPIGTGDRALWLDGDRGAAGWPVRGRVPVRVPGA